MKKIISTILLLLFITTISAQNWGNNKRIKGNGIIVTVDRTMADYDAISVGGSFNVVLKKGAEGKISIKGEENIIPYLETEVDGKTLKINYKRKTNISSTRRMTVTVNVQSIDDLSLGGSGNIYSDDAIKSDEFSVKLGGSGNIKIKVDANEINGKIGGSGDIKLMGTTKDFSASIAGSGSIKAYDLSTNMANVTIAGSGSVRITVKDEIKTKIVGSGSVYYKGKPSKVDTKSLGSGSVIDRN